MIISFGRRYIFVHIPKTGGTSLAHALEERAMANDILIGDTPKAKRRKSRLKTLNPAGRLWKHSTLADIDGIVDGAQLDKMTIFTLVRNPWDRLVSYYQWLKLQDFAHPAVAAAKTKCFDDFLHDPVIEASMRAGSAASYMRDATGRTHAAHFIRLEHFEQDFAPLSRHLGFDIVLPHLNKSERDTDYRGYYSHAAIDWIADICATDIEQFGYRFE